MPIPEYTHGMLIATGTFLPPLNKIESCFNFLMEKFVLIASLALVGLTVPITIDVILRLFTSYSVFGLLDMESIGLLTIGFFSVGCATAKRMNLQVDILFQLFSKTWQLRLHFP